MNLDLIIERFAEGLAFVDANTSLQNANPRTGEIYLPGVKTLKEAQFVRELAMWWREHHAGDFDDGSCLATEIPYPDQVRQKCDIVISRAADSHFYDWAVEVKHIALVGSNGKANDFGVAKILSPYLKDRSLVHDIRRLGRARLARQMAVVGYCFDYSFATCNEAHKRHPDSGEVISNLRDVCKRNNSQTGSLSVKPLLLYADRIFDLEGLTQPLKVREFGGAWRHPCGGQGHVFGWVLNDARAAQ